MKTLPTDTVEFEEGDWIVSRREKFREAPDGAKLEKHTVVLIKHKGRVVCQGRGPIPLENAIAMVKHWIASGHVPKRVAKCRADLTAKEREKASMKGQHPEMFDTGLLEREMEFKPWELNKKDNKSTKPTQNHAN